MRGNPKRARFPELWDSEYVPIMGGLEEDAAGMVIKPGRLYSVRNWEHVFGVQGARTIKGYERFDGRAKPSECNYAVLPFDTGSSAIVAGNTVTDGALASATVVSVTLTSGSWAGGDAAGALLLVGLTGEWENNDLIRVGGVTYALASDDITIGSVGYSGHVAALTAAREYLRALIQKPTGEGAILGVAVFNEAVYCVRNIVGNGSATLWKSGAGGWTSVRTGLHPSTDYRFEVANFSGSSTEVTLFGVSGRGRLFSLTRADVFAYADPIYGSEALSTTAVTIGLGAKTFTSATASRNWQNGDAITIWQQTDAANYMNGTVTAYNSGTGQLDVNVTSVGGAGTISAWEIGLTDYSDKPYLVDSFKDHLFLAYPYGQLQSSDLGSPMTYTTTAALFGIGAEITGISSLRGVLLGVFARNLIKKLSGSSSLDWVMEDHTTDTGAMEGSVQDIAGNAIFLDDKGLTTLQATQNFGDFEPAIMSKNVRTTLQAKFTHVVGSRMAKETNQYRLYFDDGQALRCSIMSGNPVLTPKDVAFTISEYDHVPTCFAAGIMADGREHNFMGTEDGYVMEEDAGTSFDGASIVYSLFLPYNHFKSPDVEKNFHKMSAEFLSTDFVSVNFRQLFNYDNGLYRHGGTSLMDIDAIGGAFDLDAFDTVQMDRARVVQVDSDLDGIGSNMALIVFFESGFVRPVTLQGLLIYYSRAGLQRSKGGPSA